jgi:hypothetical protein
MKPNMIIIRIKEDEENAEPTFVQLEISEDGLVAEVGKKFTVLGDDDSYLKMTYANIVFAIKESHGSRDILWTTIVDNDGEPVEIRDVSYNDLIAYVKCVMREEFTTH